MAAGPFFEPSYRPPPPMSPQEWAEVFRAGQVAAPSLAVALAAMAAKCEEIARRERP